MKTTKFDGTSKFSPQPKPEKKEKKKKYRIPPRSKKRIEKNEKYLILKDEFLKDKICPITKKKATEVHHTYSGKDRDTYFLDVDTWMAVSRAGHNWIHKFSKEARVLGYLK